MDAPRIIWCFIMVLGLIFVLYVRIRFPSPSKVEETGARVAAVVLFVLLLCLTLKHG